MMKRKQRLGFISNNLFEEFLRAHGRAIQKEPRLTKEEFLERLIKIGLKTKGFDIEEVQPAP